MYDIIIDKNTNKVLSIHKRLRSEPVAKKKGCYVRTLKNKPQAIIEPIKDVAFLASGGLGDDLIKLNAIYKLKRTKYQHTNLVYFCRQYYDIYDDMNWITFKVTGKPGYSYLGSMVKKYAEVYDLRYVAKKMGAPATEYEDIWQDHFKAKRCLDIHAMKLMNSSLGITTDWYELPPPILDDDITQFKIKKPYVVISNGTDPTQPPQTKSILNSTLIKLIEALSQEFTIIEIGSDQRAQSNSSKSTDLIEQTSLKQAIKIVKESVTMIACEGGMAHIAAWIYKPSVILFGPTPISFWGYPIHTNIQSYSCAPCFLERRFWHTVCPRGNVCMKNFPIDKIIEEVRRTYGG